MSIINIVGAKIWGGGEQYVYDICKQLQQRHRAAYTLVDQSNEEMQSRYAQVGHVMTANLYTLKGFLSVNAVAKQMKAQGINTIVCHSGKYILFCIALKQLTGAKLMFIKHNLVPGKTDMYHKWINSQVDAFVCVSKLVYDDLMTPIIKNTSKYYIVYNGIDPNRFLSFADNVPMKSKVTTFGYSARITERKGLYLILSALEQIHQKNPDIRLIISGAGTEDQIKKLQEYFLLLTPREQEILIYRYGLNKHKVYTQKEIASTMHISRSYVSRLEKRALIKLLKAYLNDK